MDEHQLYGGMHSALSTTLLLWKGSSVVEIQHSGLRNRQVRARRVHYAGTAHGR
jgi:hypothetical protein